MAKDRCKDSWGEPDDVNKTITAYGTNEQWIYGCSYVYFDESGRITAIQNEERLFSHGNDRSAIR